MTKTKEDRIRVLQEGTPQVKAQLLYSIGAALDLDDLVVAAIESLLDDRNVVRMFIPFRYGELRYCAADTLAQIRGRRADLAPIVLRQALRALRSEDMQAIRLAAGLDTYRGGPVKNFEDLRDRGLLSYVDETFYPGDYATAP